MRAAGTVVEQRRGACQRLTARLSLARRSVSESAFANDPSFGTARPRRERNAELQG
jgi:hypothetical protein